MRPERLLSEMAPRCRGVLGVLFGHRFTVRVGDVVYKTCYCGRCGYVPKGVS